MPPFGRQASGQTGERADLEWCGTQRSYGPRYDCLIIETESRALSMSDQPPGGVLKCARHWSGASGSQTHARIADDVAEQGARRIGIIWQFSRQ